MTVLPYLSLCILVIDHRYGWTPRDSGDGTAAQNATRPVNGDGVFPPATIRTLGVCDKSRPLLSESPGAAISNFRTPLLIIEKRSEVLVP